MIRKNTVMNTPVLALLLFLSGGVAHGQTSPKWLRCSASDECEVSAVESLVQSHTEKVIKRAASACLAAGYSRYSIVDSRTESVPPFTTRLVALVHFFHDAEAGGGPCNLAAKPELVREAEQIARRNGYDWPVAQRGPEPPEQWTFEPGENEWGERLPGLDEIYSPPTLSLGRNQNLVGSAVLSRFCSVMVMASSLDSEERTWWAATDGLDGPDRIAEIRVDGVTLKNDGKNVVVPNVGMIGASKRSFGVSVWSAEHEEAAAFMWSVTDRDRATIAENFSHCIP